MYLYCIAILDLLHALVLGSTDHRDLKVLMEFALHLASAAPGIGAKTTRSARGELSTSSLIVNSFYLVLFPSLFCTFSSHHRSEAFFCLLNLRSLSRDKLTTPTAMLYSFFGFLFLSFLGSSNAFPMVQDRSFEVCTTLTDDFKSDAPIGPCTLKLEDVPAIGFGVPNDLMQNCALAVRDLCNSLSEPTINQWIHYRYKDCEVSTWQPGPSSHGSYDSCVGDIFGHMLQRLSSQTIMNQAYVNLVIQPSHVSTGTAVNPDYPSYIVKA